MDNNDTRRRTTTNTEDAVRSTAYARLLKLMQGPADHWDRPAGGWGSQPAGAPAEERADANSAYRLATRALRRGELDAARAAFTLALTEQHPGAAFRIVLTKPRRSPSEVVVIAEGGGKTEHFLLWVMRHLMTAARWGHADAQRLLDGVQSRPPRPLERVLADAQHPASAAGAGLWSGLTFTCPPLTYEAQDDEFYPAVRDVLAQLLKAPAAALEAGPSSRARALPAGRPRIALPPGSSGISQQPLDAFSSFQSGAENPAATPPTVHEALELADSGGPARPSPFNGRFLWGTPAGFRVLGVCAGWAGQSRSASGEEQSVFLLRGAHADLLGDVFPVAGGMSAVRDISFAGYPERSCWDNVIRHAVFLVSGRTETAVMPLVLSTETCASQDVAAAIRISSARSAPGLWDPHLVCPHSQPASVLMAAVTREGDVRVWDLGSAPIRSLASDGPTPPGRVRPLDADLAGLSMHSRNSTFALLTTCTAETADEGGWLAAVLRGLHPGEREVVFAYTAAPGRRWEEAAAVLGVRDPAAVGERVRRKVKRLAAQQQRRTAQRRVEYPGTPTADPGPRGLTPPLAAMLSTL